MSTLLDGPLLVVEDGGAALGHQVHLHAARATARAWAPPGRSPLTCELVLDPDGGLVFGLGALDEQRVRALRTGALAGDGATALLRRVAGVGRGPVAALIGRLAPAGQDHRLQWDAEGATPPLLLPDGSLVPQEPAGTLLPPGTVVAALAGVPGTAQRGLVRAQTTVEDETCAGLLDAAVRHARGPAAALTLSLDAVEPDLHVLLRHLHDARTGLPGPLLAFDRLRQATVCLDRESSGVVVLGVLLPRTMRSGAAVQALGDRLAGALRPGDTVALWQDDVLLAVCGHVADLEDAQRLTLRARAAVGADGPGAGGRLAALVVWDALSDEELALLPERVAWAAWNNNPGTAVLEVSRGS